MYKLILVLIFAANSYAQTNQEVVANVMQNMRIFQAPAAQVPPSYSALLNELAIAARAQNDGNISNIARSKIEFDNNFKAIIQREIDLSWEVERAERLQPYLNGADINLLLK